ncbi:MAG TPA: hypothetical protein VGI85_02880 [Chthoniobacterales bacterium]
MCSAIIPESPADVKLDRFFAELRRRNVYKATAAYAIVAWLIIQFATQVFPFFGIPDWTVRLLVLLSIVGAPAAVLFAWAYELTPEGIRRTADVAPEESIRHQTGRKLMAAIVVLLSIAVGIWAFQMLRPRAGGLVTRIAPPAVVVAAKSVAVLPFENLSDEKGSEYLADGVQDEVLTDLAHVADLKVISRTSVMQYKAGALRNLREIGRQLGVAHILEGAVRCVGDRVRISAQLIDARTDLHEWAENYDRPLDDVFAIQTEIAKAIADQLQAKIAPNEKAAMEERPTTDLTAFDLYVRAGRLLLRTSFSTRGRDNLLEAVRLLQRAVVRDPHFLSAYCQLAAANDGLYFLGFDHSPERLSLGDAAVTAALRLKPDSPEAHLARARHLYQGYLAYDPALAELAIARAALPNNSSVFALAGYIYRRQGRWEESTRDFENALAIDPRNFYTLQQLSLSYNLLRRYPEMIATLDRALAIVPNDLDTLVTRAEVDLNWRADPRPLHTMIDRLLAQNPAAATDLADAWLFLALSERDFAAADRALAALKNESFGVDAIQLSRAFGEGLAARAKGDAAAARAAFSVARAEQERVVAKQEGYAPALCILGLIDAGLGRKDEAIKEGREAVQLLPLTRDPINGAHLIEFLAVIYAWTGQARLACDELEIATKIPGTLSYGQLRLYPFWDPLREDARFEKIVASLAAAAGK